MRFPFKGGRALRTRLARPEPFAQPPVQRRMLTCDRGADRAVSTHAANADGCCCRATFQRHCAVAGAASAGWRARAVRRRIALCSGVRGVQAPATWHCQSCASGRRARAGRLTRVVRSSCDEDHALPTASRPRSQRRSSRGARLDVEVPRRPRWRWRPAHHGPAPPTSGWASPTHPRLGRPHPPQAGPAPPGWAGPTPLGWHPRAGPAGVPPQVGQGCHPRPGCSAHPGRAGPSYPGRHPRRATYVCAPNTCARFLHTANRAVKIQS